MLIPRGVLKLEKIAAHEKTRYAMNGLLLDRDPVTREAIACATDGKRLLEARWDDSTLRNDFPASINLEERTKFFTVVPCDAIKASEKAVPKKGKPCLRYLAVDEVSANGTVKLATVSEAGPCLSEVKSVEGHFPPYLEVLPKSGNARVRIGLNPRLLLELAEALHAARESGNEEPNVYLDIAGPDQAIEVRAMGPNLSGVKTRAVLMPINTGEPQPVRSCDCDHCKSLRVEEKAASAPPKLPGETTTPDGVRMVPAIFVRPEKGKRSRKAKTPASASSPDPVTDKAACSAPDVPRIAPGVMSDAPSPACPAELAPTVEPARVLGASDLEW